MTTRDPKGSSNPTLAQYAKKPMKVCRGTCWGYDYSRFAHRAAWKGTAREYQFQDETDALGLRIVRRINV